MSDVDNPARDLAATGTGPWLVCRTQYGSSIEDAEDGGQVFIESYGITYTPDPADATKVVRAVNALPAIADLLDLLAAHRRVAHPSETFCAACFEDWPCPTTTARDRVAAALTGDTDG